MAISWEIMAERLPDSRKKKARLSVRAGHMGELVGFLTRDVTLPLPG
jgi:hypothetical protein